MSIIKYRPEIDGLRALAVIPVVLFHLGFRPIHGGFAGVDVFFVISGYLITSIILRERQQGTFTFPGFWKRRARRILPALACMVLATTVAGIFIAHKSDWKSLGGQGLSVFALLANFRMWKLTGGYWAPLAHDTPLLHTWSLAVEEQFYLIYPLLLISMLYCLKKHAFKIILAGTVLSFILCVFATDPYPRASFYLLPTRAWELAAGCLLAMLSSDRPDGFTNSRFASILSCAGVAIITASYFFISEDRGFPGYQALAPVAGALLVLGFAASNHFTGGLLASAPVRYIGKISYSLYLWHWPVIVCARIAGREHGAAIPLFPVILLFSTLSVASYHLIEKPARFAKRWVLPLTVLTLTSITASAGLYFWHIQYDFSAFDPVVWNGKIYDVTPTQTPWQGAAADRMAGIVAPLREQPYSRAFAEQGIIKQYGTPNPEVVVFGDSHALMWASTIDAICKDLGVTVSFFTADGTSLHIADPPARKAALFFTSDEKFLFDSARLRCLKEWKPKLVILSSRWSGVMDRSAVDSMVDVIARNKSKILLIEQPPEMPFGDRNALIYCAEANERNSKDGNMYLPVGNFENWNSGKKLIESLATGHDICNLVEISDIYLIAPRTGWLKEGRSILYIDDDHLSEFGARKAKDRIASRIRDLVGTSH